MRTQRIVSGAPLVCSGLVVLAYALILGLASPVSYLMAAGLGFLVYAPLRNFFPDRFKVVEVAPETGNPACDQLILETRNTLKLLHEQRKLIQAGWICDKIDMIEVFSRQIIVALTKQPELQSEVRTFFHYYMPAALRLAESRVRLQGEAVTEASQATLKRVDEGIGLIERACEHELDALDEYRFLDVEAELEVLRDLMADDGILGDTLSSGPGGAESVQHGA